MVGVTDHPVYDELFSAVARDLSCIIVSTADIGNVIDADRTTAAGYVLFEIAAELLTIEYRCLTTERFDPAECKAPWHIARRSCIFDYDDERQHTGGKMLRPQLCEECKLRLRNAGVALSIERAVLRIARAGLAPFRAWLRRAVPRGWAMLFAGFIGHLGRTFGLLCALVALALVWGLMLLAERRD